MKELNSVSDYFLGNIKTDTISGTSDDDEHDKNENSKEGNTNHFSQLGTYPKFVSPAFVLTS